MRLHDDFIEIQPGAIAQLQRTLDQFGNPGTRGAGKGESSTDLLRLISRLVGNTIKSLGTRVGLGRLSNLPMYSEPNLTAKSKKRRKNESSRPMYILLCMNSGRVGTTLHHESLQEIQSDKELFDLLRSSYRIRRSSIKSLFSFRAVNKISLVKVCIIQLYIHFT
jgi:hypothetical protein